MWCRVTEECFTRDCRHVREGAIDWWGGPTEQRPHYYEPLTDRELLKHEARLEMQGQQLEIPEGLDLDAPVRAAQETAPDGGDRATRLGLALQRLDHWNDDHWVSNGMPAMSAVGAFMGDPSVTRAELMAHAPDLTRLPEDERPPRSPRVA